MKTNLITKGVARAKDVCINTGFALKKHSPEILLVGGTVAVLAGVVFACKATTKMDEIIAEAQARKNDIQDKAEHNELTEQETKKEMAKACIKTAGKVAKNYAVPAMLVIGGLGCIYGSHGILCKRNSGLIALAAAGDKAFNAYRDRVRERFGDDVENDIYEGRVTEEVKVKEKLEDGTTKTTKKKISKYKETDPSNLSPYARFFNDETAQSYHKNDPTYNAKFLAAMQRVANDYCNIYNKRKLSLNQVYNWLGMEEDQDYGYYIGWDPTDPNFEGVSFGFNPESRKGIEFLSGLEPTFLCDFNVTGSLLTNHRVIPKHDKKPVIA